MKTAKEMFEELGYKQEIEDDIIRYTYIEGYSSHTFTFLNTYMVYDDDGLDNFAKFNISLIKAINKQMKELNW